MYWVMIDGWMIEDVYHAATTGKEAIDYARQFFCRDYVI